MILCTVVLPCHDFSCLVTDSSRGLPSIFMYIYCFHRLSGMLQVSAEDE